MQKNHFGLCKYYRCSSFAECVLIGKTLKEPFFCKGQEVRQLRISFSLLFVAVANLLLTPSVGSYASSPPTVGILAVEAITVRVAKRGWRYPIFSLCLVHDLGTGVS